MSIEKTMKEFDEKFFININITEESAKLYGYKGWLDGDITNVPVASRATIKNFIKEKLEQQREEIVEEIESGIKNLASMNNAGIKPTMMNYAQVLYDSINNTK